MIDSLAHFLDFLARQVRDLRCESTGEDEWAVGWGQWTPDVLWKDLSALPITWIPQPPGHFYADPFGLRVDNSVHIFFEDYSYAEQRGRISMVTLGEGTAVSSPQVVLESSFHLSYPFLFSWEGRHYAVPEQYQSGEVALYEIGTPGERWVKKAVLLSNYPGVDATLFAWNNRWWMWVGREDRSPERAIDLFFADCPEGPWTAHPQNPISSGLPNMRSAGALWCYGGKLLRPAQDSSRTYGGHLVWKEVLELTPSAYREELYCQARPLAGGPYREGLHTVNSLGAITLIDAKRWRQVPACWPRVLRRKWDRLWKR